MRFEPSADTRLDIALFGQEQTPVIQIDEALGDPASLVRYAALEAQFEAVGSNLYPGIRAAMPLDYVESAVRALDPLIRKTYQIESAKLANAECFFSIVTTPPGQLHPLQKVPHIDTTSSLHFAVLHFLCDERFGGTAFYRQNQTGFEIITPLQEFDWAQSRDKGIEKLPGSAGYVGADSDEYRQIGFVPAQFNRMIIYPSNLLHSGSIPSDMVFSADPAVGRLTANFFIGYNPA